MSAAQLTEAELDDIGGDCRSYLQLCRCRRERADSLGLSREQRHAWDDLVGAADFRTGIVESITWEGTAELLGCSIPTAKKWLGTLAELDLIAYRFPQGHPGFIAVVSYLDVVRVKPSRAAEIHASLARASERARARANPKSPNGADQAEVASDPAETLRSDDENFRIENTAPLPKQIAERTGRTADSTSPEIGLAPFSSPMRDGRRSRGTTLHRSREGTRLSRSERWCPLLRDPRCPATEVPVTVRRCARQPHPGTEQPCLDFGLSDGY